MKNLKAVIIDDEVNAVKAIVTMLSEFTEGVEVIGTANSAITGVKLLNTTQPDIVFLDVEMPGGTGFDLLEALPNHKFSVIFTTAYSKYAIEAIKAEARDYLVKPIDIEELVAAVAKIRTKLKDSPEANKLSVPVMNGFRYLDLATIVMLKAERSYTQFHLLGGETLLVSKHLKHYEDLLAEKGFFRSHKSYLVNLKHVASYSRSDGGVITLVGEVEAGLAKDKRDGFLVEMAAIG